MKIKRGDDQLIREVSKALRIIGPELHMNVYSIVDKMLEDGVQLSPLELQSRLAKLGVFVERGDIVRAMFARLYPAGSKRATAIKSIVEGIAESSNLPAEKKSVLADVLLKYFDIEEARVRFGEPVNTGKE